MIRIAKHIIVLYILTIITGTASFAQVDDVSLMGGWKFKIGDNPEWASNKFDDSAWNTIKAPANWENQGYRGYDGYAWYRKHITLDKTYNYQMLILQLGYIDDVDEVYINGHKIGQSGSFPPRFSTAYNALRRYSIPINVIRFDADNVIAVRIYDSQLSGGIVDGDLKIFSQGEAVNLDIDLSGDWMLNPGKVTNDEKARSVLVPGMWENQGFLYDGYAVYSRWIDVPQKLINERLVFMAGRIDDVDRVYINGQLVGATGNYEQGMGEGNHTEFRNYFLAPGTLKQGKNFIEIKVFDERWDGGIVQGPVGLITQTKFRQYWHKKRLQGKVF